jgi:RNA polymerase sigma factor (sigma-70 family)
VTKLVCEFSPVEYKADTKLSRLTGIPRSQLTRNKFIPQQFSGQKKLGVVALADALHTSHDRTPTGQQLFFKKGALFLQNSCKVITGENTRDMEPPETRPPPEFLAALRAQQQDAWEQLYQRYFAHLSRRYTEDIAQEAFLQAYHHIAIYHADGSLRRWLWSIARHCMIDHAQQATHAHFSAHAFTAWLCRLGTPHAGEALDAQLDARTLLTTAIQTLSVHDQALFLRYLEGESQRQIADALGRREGAINVALSRIRAGLRKTLHKDFPSRQSSQERPI